MSFAGKITSMIVIAGASIPALHYTVGVPFVEKNETAIAPGYANPKYLDIEKKESESGILATLVYDDGTKREELGIFLSESGIIVGSLESYWAKISAQAKSGLVEQSWDTLEVDTRKSILQNDLEKMIETYGGN